MKKHILILIAVILLLLCSCQTAAPNAESSSSNPMQESEETKDVSFPSTFSKSEKENVPPTSGNDVSSKQEDPTVDSRIPDILPSAPDTSQDTATSSLSSVPPFSDIASIYTRTYSGYTYVGAWLDSENPNLPEFETEAKKCLALFEGLEPAGEEYPITDNEFLIWTKDGVRHTYGTARGGYLIADGVTYLLPQDRVLSVQSAHDYLNQTSDYAHAFPRWLVWMTHSKIQEIIFHSPTRGSLSIAPDLIKHAAVFATQAVRPNLDSTYSLGSVDYSGGDVFHLEIRFDNGIIYHIYAKNTGYEADYYVESSDMPYGCMYRLNMVSAEGPAHYLIGAFEYISDAKSMKDVENPTT